MKIPKRLEPLLEDGLIDEVLSALKSGKEASVYVVRCGNDIRCAKVYKEASQRSFKKAVEYQEGRKVRNSRRGRAMEKGSRFGRQEQESAWQSAEVDALFRLAAAGVRVPTPHMCVDGVLLMDLVTDADGHVAPRLNDVELPRDTAIAYHRTMMDEIVRMLCAGLIHGDLSEFNVLLGPDGPVIIDLPQAVDAAGNNNARRMLERDVANMTGYFGRFAPELLATDYGHEIWTHYEAGRLSPGMPLTGKLKRSEHRADVGSVMREIDAAREEAALRAALRREAESPEE